MLGFFPAVEILAVLDIGLDQTDREKAKKNLAAERAKQGLSTDDAVLEGLLDQQITSPDSKKVKSYFTFSKQYDIS